MRSLEGYIFDMFLLLLTFSIFVKTSASVDLGICNLSNLLFVYRKCKNNVSGQFSNLDFRF